MVGNVDMRAVGGYPLTIGLRTINDLPGAV